MRRAGPNSLTNDGLARDAGVFNLLRERHGADFVLARKIRRGLRITRTRCVPEIAHARPSPVVSLQQESMLGHILESTLVFARAGIT